MTYYKNHFTNYRHLSTAILHNRILAITVPAPKRLSLLPTGIIGNSIPMRMQRILIIILRLP